MKVFYIALDLFGSYNTEQWIRNKSDIDILVLLDEKTEIHLKSR